MRVCMLGDGWFPDQPGGLNRYLRSLLHALVCDGLDARAVVVGPASDEPSNVEVPVVGSARLDRRLLATLRAIPSDVDVFDSHFVLYSFAPALVGRFRSVPLVVHFHGPWGDESLAAGTSSRIVAETKRLAERFVYGRARAIVTLSGAFKRLLVEQYSVLPWQVTVIPPGVDLEQFSLGEQAEARRRLGLPIDAWIVLCVRRLTPRMGLDVLLEAWAHSGRSNSMLLIGGDGPERLRLEETAAALRVTGSTRFLGRVDDANLPDYYRAADLSVVPSRDLEGFGLVALESLACGTPVVSSDTGGLSEAVRELEPKLVALPGDASSLAQKLEEARSGAHPSRETCRAHAERFSWSDVAAEHRRLYQRVLRSQPRNRFRVVYLSHTASLGGGELALLRLLPALTDVVEPHVILAEDGVLATRLVQAGISVEVLSMAAKSRAARRDSLGARDALGAASYAIRLASRLRRLQPDLVHTNSLKAALYGGAASRLVGVPAIWHARDRIADDYMPAGAVRMVQTASRFLPSAIIANSRATLATLPKVQRSYVIPSPILLVDIPPTVDANRHFRAGILGRIAPWKGQHIFIEAFAKAFPAGPEEAVVIGGPLFGRDEVAYFDRLRALGRQLGLGSRLIFSGFTEDVTIELSRLDVLVHASVQPEPFGQVILEGMAARLPVIASAAGGPLEFVDEGIDGLLYPPGDVGALSRALRHLAADPDLCARLGDAGQAKARRFTPDYVAPQVVAVYRELLDAMVNRRFTAPRVQG